MVYADLNQNPLIVPLEIQHGHLSSDRRGTQSYIIRFPCRYCKAVIWLTGFCYLSPCRGFGLQIPPKTAVVVHRWCRLGDQALLRVAFKEHGMILAGSIQWSMLHCCVNGHRKDCLVYLLAIAVLYRVVVSFSWLLITIRWEVESGASVAV